MGGRAITIHIGAQSRAQLRQRWGADGAAAILNNTATHPIDSNPSILQLCL